MRAIARDETSPHASPYRRVPRLGAPLQPPIESQDGKNGIQQPDGCPAPLVPLSASLRRKTTQAHPKHPWGALGTAGAGGVRGDAPSPNAPVNRPAPSTTKIALNHAPASAPGATQHAAAARRPRRRPRRRAPLFQFDRMNRSARSAINHPRRPQYPQKRQTEPRCARSPRRPFPRYNPSR